MFVNIFVKSVKKKRSMNLMKHEMLLEFSFVSNVIVVYKT